MVTHDALGDDIYHQLCRVVYFQHDALWQRFVCSSLDPQWPGEARAKVDAAS